MHKTFFGYIRVSTAKQGVNGVSLQEQREAIAAYAQRSGLTVSEWFEERESAAKRGRPVFARMIRLLRQEKASGVIIHKIDRSTRNLKDWADLGELIDTGVEVRFANEGIDLNTRGGRLSADIQAVVASDYIRNLREETKKGFYGRLKQGIYPLPAPLGYIDKGKGAPKEPDPSTAPLVAKAFHLYASGDYSLTKLASEMYGQGLRSKRGGRVSVSGLSHMLNNPFYKGVIRISKTEELFVGAHSPLVSDEMFDRVGAVLSGKAVNRVTSHDFTFRRFVRCASCGYFLVGELQKGHVYYRCHSASCPTTSIREESVDEVIEQTLERLRIDDKEYEYYRGWAREVQLHEDSQRFEQVNTFRLRLETIRARRTRLTDALIDGAIEKSVFDERKNALVVEERATLERLRSAEAVDRPSLRSVEIFLELLKIAPNLYKHFEPAEKRELIRNLASNLRACQKNVEIVPLQATEIMLNRPRFLYGTPCRGVPRTVDSFRNTLDKLVRALANLETSTVAGQQVAS